MFCNNWRVWATILYTCISQRKRVRRTEANIRHILPNGYLCTKSVWNEGYASRPDTHTNGPSVQSICDLNRSDASRYVCHLRHIFICSGFTARAPRVCDFCVNISNTHWQICPSSQSTKATEQTQPHTHTQITLWDVRSCPNTPHMKCGEFLVHKHK